MVQNTKYKVGGDLINRLISAAVLIPFGLYTVWTGGGVLLSACALCAIIMAYEWIRMSSSPSLSGFVTLSTIPFITTAIAGIVAGTVGLVLCTLIVGRLHPLKHKRTLEQFGFIYVTIMPFAFYALRDGHWDGRLAALLVMLIVWASDSAAYFIGRLIGGPGLHADSPSKTWSGAIAAITVSMFCGLLAALIANGNGWLWLVTGGLISLFAQLGDLLESAIKRHFKVKDAGRLLPGHGGIMDRVDGLGLTFVCMLVVLLTMPNIVAKLGLET